MNRFSKDMGAIDEMLPVALMDCIQVIYNIYIYLLTLYSMYATICFFFFINVINI